MLYNYIKQYNWIDTGCTAKQTHIVQLAGCTDTCCTTIQTQVIQLYITRSTKKGSSKPINMGSSFEDLNETKTVVKTDCNLRSQFER